MIYTVHDDRYWIYLCAVPALRATATPRVSRRDSCGMDQR